jgi:poly(3-hydroxyalkanoate) depolymerase
MGSQRIRLTIESPGAGVPLLLINGIGATGELFGPFRRHLTERETIAFDAPGVGRSSTPLLPMKMAQLADIVARLVADIGHDRIDALGISWGGALTMELAHRHPRLVRRMVLTATMPGLGGVLGRPAALSVLASPARFYSPDYLRRVAPTLYGPGILARPELLAAHTELRTTRRPSLRGYWYQLLAIQTWSALPYLHRLRQPTLVLAGDNDPIIPVGNGRILASRIPDARLHVVEGGGHLHLFVRAEEMVGIVRAFLDEDEVGG